MQRIRQETTLWVGAVTLGTVAVVGAAVLDGQITVTRDVQTGSASAMVGGPAAPPMDPGTGLIVGRAVEAGTARPVPGALVTLTLPGAAPLRVMADAQGQFAFRDLPKGRFAVSAVKAGYVDGAYGRVRPAGPTQVIDLTTDQRATDANISLWKYGVIAGRVLDEDGDPVVGTTVRVLKRTIVAGKRQLVMGTTGSTDDRGMYRISSLDPGDYVIVVPMAHGSGIESMLQSLGIRDLPPMPTGGGGGAAMVFNFNVQSNGAGTTTTVMSGPDAAVAPAGRTSDGHVLAYQTEFYPSSVSSSRATSVTVNSGEERTGVDFQLKPVRTVTVSGTVNGADGTSRSIPLRLIPAEADDLVTPIETASATSDANGTFRFEDVPPGQYTLRAFRAPGITLAGLAGGTTMTQSFGGGMVRTVAGMAIGGGAAPPLPTEPTQWADMNVSVGADDLNNVTVPLRNGLRVSGRVEFNGSADRPAPEQLPSIAISLDPADGRTSGATGTVRGRVETTGQFQTMGVPVGKYVLRVGAPSGWTLRSAMLNGQDIIDTPVELREGDAAGVVIAFTDRAAGLTGSVTAASGTPDGAAAVIVFPTDHNLWTGTGSSPRRLKNARTDKNGSYSLSSLPPGDYFIAAVSDAAAADWQSPDFLDALSRSAMRMHLDDGEKKTQPLQTARTPGR